MKKLQILRLLLKESGAEKIFRGFLIFFLICAALILWREPEIRSYGDALWYCFSLVTTVGFGDVLATTAFSRSISVILSIYALLVIAIVTGLVVSFFNRLTDLRQRKILTEIMIDPQQLLELSEAELKELANVTIACLNQKRGGKGASETQNGDESGD